MDIALSKPISLPKNSFEKFLLLLNFNLSLKLPSTFRLPLRNIHGTQCFKDNYSAYRPLALIAVGIFTYFLHQLIFLSSDVTNYFCSAWIFYITYPAR